MKRTINKILTLEHTSNQYNKHEKQIEAILKDHGYVKKTIKQLNFEKQAIRDTKYDKSDNTMWYIPQPCGTQSFPDFIVGDKLGNIFYLECKSNKNDSIVWNSGMPKSKAIYIFSSGKHNKQTVAMGSDLWSKEEIELQQKIRKVIEETYKPLNDTGHKVKYYGRHMHVDKKLVYGNENRLKREKSVYKFIAEKIKCQNS